METMRKLKLRNRGLVLIALIALIFAFSSPVYARTFRIGSYYLNIYGNSGTSLQGRRLSMYTDGSIPDSQFSLEYYNGSQVIKAAQNLNYAVNKSSVDGKAIIWPVASGFYDSALKPTDGVYMELLNYDVMDLQAASLSQYAVVHWGGVSSTNNHWS